MPNRKFFNFELVIFKNHFYFIIICFLIHIYFKQGLSTKQIYLIDKAIQELKFKSK